MHCQDRDITSRPDETWEGEEILWLPWQWQHGAMAKKNKDKEYSLQTYFRKLWEKKKKKL